MTFKAKLEEYITRADYIKKQIQKKEEPAPVAAHGGDKKKGYELIQY
jgi:hypothetical protein